jgi:ribosomal protein L24
MDQKLALKQLLEGLKIVEMARKKIEKQETDSIDEEIEIEHSNVIFVTIHPVSDLFNLLLGRR